MRQRHGFSLIELLTVLAVLAVVSTIGTTMFFKVNDLWQQTMLRGQLDDTMSSIDNQLSRDFGMVFSSTLSGKAIQGIRATADIPQKEENVYLALDDDRVVIPVEEVDLISKQPLRYDVTYRIRRNPEDGNAGDLVREWEVAPGEMKRLEVARGVLTMRGQYFDGEAWRDEWSSDHMPEAVRLSIVIQDADRNQPWEQIARALTYPIHVK